MNFSFPTRKLGRSIKRITDRFKDFSNENVVLTVYGVNNESGVSLTGKQSSKDLSNYIYVSGNQFVYNPYRVNIGSIGLTPKNFKGVVSPAYVVFETKNDLDSEYLLFYLKSATGNNLIRWYGNRGGVRSALRYSDLCKLDIPALTIEDQEKALIRFKAAQKESDKLFHELESQNGNINNLRQAILRLAVRGKLVCQDPNDEPVSELLKKIKAEKEKLIKEGKIKKQKPFPPIDVDEMPYKIPKEWRWVRFGQLINSMTNGIYKPSKYYSENGVGCLRMYNIQDGRFNLINLKRMILTEQELEQYRLEKNNLLVNRVNSRELVGKTAIIDELIEPLIFESKNIRVCCSENSVFPYYANIFMRTREVRSAFEGDAKQTCGQASISQPQIASLLLPLPPLAEQKGIVAKVDDLMALCDRLEEKLQQSLTDSDKLMASVVHHLLHRPLPEEQLVADKKKPQTPYKDDAAVVCFLLAEMEKLHRPTTEFFIQKHIFLTKHHLHLPVNSVFKRKVAGPWSQELRWKAIEAAIKMNWLRCEKKRFVAGSAFEKALNHAATVLGETAAQIAQLVEDLKAFGNNGLERWTTVLKVVQDLKETQQPITRSNIQREINNWPGKSLKEIFAEESVDHTITMMLKHNWLPPAAGQ